jgi:hypothetical protein
MILSCLTLFCPVQAYTTVTGTITSDTSWTKNGSPYNLASNFVIPSGITLTIGPGVTINSGNFAFIVNGTLNARGTSENKIFFNVNSSNPYSFGQISFTSFSEAWNEQTGQGCIVENAVFNSYAILISSSIKLSNIESNRIVMIGASPIIVNNRFNLTSGLQIVRGSPQILNNIFAGGSGQGIVGSGNVTFSGNKISNCSTGIQVNSGDWLISNNTITDCNTGIELNSNAKATIKGNLISNNARYGISGGANSIIDSNTITNNQIGIYNPLTATVIHNNNILGNAVNSITATSSDVDATGNWWGTTGQAAINQTIYDGVDDANWGTVYFVPFLTGPNFDAPPIPDVILAPISTSPPTEPTQPPPTTQPTPDYTPMPTVNHGLSKTNNNQDKSLLNLNTLVVAVAVLLGAVWAVVLLGYRVKGKIREIRES